MPPLESRFKTVAICLDAICLGEPTKPSTTKTTVRVFAILATFARWRVIASTRMSRRARACATILVVKFVESPQFCSYRRDNWGNSRTDRAGEIGQSHARV